MTFRSDRRGRVPFALVGVLLLVSSTVFATTLAGRELVTTDHRVETTIERTTAATQTALRDAIADAARDAAANPVTRRTDTPTGRVLNASSPFRDALRIRIYLAASEAVSTLGHRNGDVAAAVSLPRVTNASTLRRAKRRVTVRGVENDTAMRVTVSGLSVTARRDGRVVARTSLSPTVVVPTPVLLLHERTATFERQLNRGPLDGPGLGRQLTARLYPVTWARGYSRYGGLPIENVLANRHVALSTNGGVLWLQRRAFGRWDPAARRGLDRATLQVLARDVLEPTPLDGKPVADRLLRRPNGEGGAQGIPPLVDESVAERTVRVGVNHSADRAFEAFVTSGAFEDLRRDAYRVEATLDVSVTKVSSGEPAPPNRPGENWTLTGTDRRTRRSVRSAPTPERPSAREMPDEASFGALARTVVEHHTLRRTWVRGNQTRHRQTRWRSTYRVVLRFEGTHRPRAPAPDRVVRPRFERGGVLDGPNLADVPERARQALLADNGGADRIARRAVAGGDRRYATVVYGARPANLRAWAYRDLVALRERVRNQSVAVEGVTLASGTANPAERLAADLRERRDELLDAPLTYRGVADRARVAARVAFLDRVLAELDRRARETEDANRAFAGVLEKRDAVSGRRLAGIGRSLDVGTTPPARRFGGVAGPVSTTPVGSPGYLSLETVRERRTGSAASEYYPLVARNHNLFVVPYGDTADTVVDAVLPERRGVPLSTAGHALVAANRTLAATTNGTLRSRRDSLQRETEQALGVVARRARGVVQSETGLSSGKSREAVAAAMRRWPGTGRQALAVANGSAGAAIARESAASAALSATRRDLLRVRLRVEIRTALERDATVQESAVAESGRSTRRVARAAAKRLIAARLRNETERASERWLDDALGAVPAGLPVAPVPGYWYATVNVWTVTVRGEYGQFVVESPVGSPREGGVVRYVREESAVSLDVDDDGVPERLGRNERIAFETGTTVAVVVPPGGVGVGDVNGDADERSSGWSRTQGSRRGDERVDGQRFSPSVPQGRACSTTPPRTRANCRPPNSARRTTPNSSTQSKP